MRNLRCHANALAQRGMRVDGFAYVNIVCAYLDGQGDVDDGEDVGHVGAHLDVDVDETAVCHSYAGFISGNFCRWGCDLLGLILCQPLACLSSLCRLDGKLSARPRPLGIT
jgi:hypothetical protein